MIYMITGGGSGIGQALAWKLAQQGDQIIIIGRREQALQKTCERFPENITAISADVSEISGREKILALLQSMSIKKIDALIHGAGIVEPITSLAHVSLEQWRLIQATNVEAPLFLTQQLLPYLENARVLLISSQIAHVAQPRLGPYCVSKAAASMLLACLQLDLQLLNIHATTMTPGIVETSMFETIVASPNIPEINRDFYHQVIKHNSWLKPEVAACFLQWLLCSLDNTAFSSQEWDIYDTSHHAKWVKGFAAPQSPGFV